MNALLIYPDHPDTFWGFKHALPFVSKKATEPPLGLLTVAALLPKNWKKKLIHMKVDQLTDKDLIWADMVFISAMSIQKSSSRKVIDICKKKGIKIVAGGPLFTTSYKDFLDVDHLVLNEAELTLPMFLEDLRMQKEKKIYSSNKFADIRNTPAPLLELIDVKKYATMDIQFSRGCPFNCDFCNITNLLGHVVRTKSKEQIISELDNIYNMGWRGGVFFVDDNFIGNKQIIKKEILPAIIEWMKIKNKPFTFKTEFSINLADDISLMRLLVKAGFDSVFIGIETPNDESLKECNKSQNRHRNLALSVKRIQSAGLQVDAGFIIGFDNDPHSIFDKLTSFIQESGIVTAMVGLLNAPYNTKLYHRLKKENRLTNDISGDNTDSSINFIPKMDYRILIDGYKKVLDGIYSAKPYYKRVKTFLELKKISFDNKKSIQINFKDIKALVKSVFILGIKDKERIHYWKLFFWSLFRKPRVFPQAIMFAIYGFHFRKIYNT